MRLLRAFDLSLFADDVGAEPLFVPATFGRSETSPTFISETTHGVVKVAPSGGSETIPLGGIVTVKALLIANSEPVSVSINGAADLDLSAPSAGRGMLYLEADATSIVITNSGSTEAEVIYALAGI